MKTVFAACPLLFLSACVADPASETPVKMTPGLYEVSLPEGDLAALGLSENGKPVQMCLYPGDGEYFPKKIVKKALAIPGCDEPKAERQGNRLTSETRCPMESSDEAIVLRSEGRVTAETFEADYRFDFPDLKTGDTATRAAMRYMSNQTGSIRATRISDCAA